MKALKDKILEGFFQNTGIHDDPEYTFQLILDDCKNIAKELKQHGFDCSRLTPGSIRPLTDKYKTVDKFKSLPYHSSITTITRSTTRIYIRVDSKQNFGYHFTMKSIFNNGKTGHSRQTPGVSAICIDLINCILKNKEIKFTV